MAGKTYTDIFKFFDDQVAHFKRFPVVMSEAVYHLAKGGLEDFEELTSGTRSKKETRGAFARNKVGKRRGAGLIPLLPINKQSERLRNSARIVIKKGRSPRDAKEIHLISTAPYARYILSDSGTVKMVARPARKEIHKRGKARMKAMDFVTNLNK